MPRKSVKECHQHINAVNRLDVLERHTHRYTRNSQSAIMSTSHETLKRSKRSKLFKLILIKWHNVNGAFDVFENFKFNVIRRSARIIRTVNEVMVRKANGQAIAGLLTGSYSILSSRSTFTICCTAIVQWMCLVKFSVQHSATLIPLLGSLKLLEALGDAWTERWRECQKFCK